MFWWETLGSDIQVVYTVHPNTVVDQVYPFMATPLPDGSGPPTQTHHKKLLLNSLRDFPEIFQKTQDCFLNRNGIDTQFSYPNEKSTEWSSNFFIYSPLKYILIKRIMFSIDHYQFFK